MGTFWTIERADLRRRSYFAVVDGCFTYTEDIEDALRLSREEDAAMLLEYIFFADATVKLTEHCA